MPREIICLHVGQCGNQIGTKFWETIAQEHGLSPDGTWTGNNDVQLEKIDVYYHETDSGRFVPRACLIDMENAVLNHISQRTYGGMFRPDNIMSSSAGAANNFMNGCYSETALDLCASVIETLRCETERTECCQGFTYTHSTSGGTGSGLTMRINDEASELLIPSFGGSYFFSVFPSNKVSNTVLEPYNSLCVLQKQKNVENVVCMDNEALFKICFMTLGINSPTFADINRVASMLLAGNTASFRFPGQVNTDMHKLSYSLRCRPFLHWYIPAFAPLTSHKCQKYRKITVAELVRQMTAEQNQMIETLPSAQDLEDNGDREIQGKCFAYAAMFRGQMSSQDVDEALAFLKGDQTLENSLRKTIGYFERSNFVLESVKTCQRYHPRNPRPTFNSITNYAPPGMPMSVTYLRNTSQIKNKFVKIVREAKRMFLTHSFTGWYDKSNYLSVKDFTPLETVINEMSTDWMPSFGLEDQTEWPGQVEDDQMRAVMTNGKARAGKPAKSPAAAPAPSPPAE